MTNGLKQRTLLVKRIILVGFVFAALSVGIDLWDYYQTRTWQTLADVAIAVLAAICLAVARWSVRREKLDAAGYWMLLAMLVGLGSGDLIWTSELVFSIGIVLLILIVGSMVLPRKWAVWLIAVGLYVAFAALVNRFEPLPRRAVTQSAERFVLDLVMVILLATAILWQFARVRRRLTTIRARLLIAFVPLTLLLAAVIGASAFWVTRNQVRRQVENQLESVATLKEVEIRSWVSDLQMNLNLVVSGKQTPRHLESLLASESVESSDYENAYDSLQGYLRWAVKQMGLFEEMFVIDLQGRVILSTDATREGKYAYQAYFQRGLEGPYVHPPSYSSWLGQMLVLAARPLGDQEGKTVAVLVGRANIDALSEIMLERAGLGETGETYLVGTNHLLLTESRFGGEGKIYVRTPGGNAALEDQVNGSGQYQSYHDAPVVGAYHWLPELQVALLAEQGTAEAYSGVRTVLLIDGGIAIGAALVVAMVSIIITNNITDPLARLAETAQEIAAGDLERTAEVEREDEMGSLAQAFNQMTGRLRDLIGDLEQEITERKRAESALREAHDKLEIRVKERTAELEQANEEVKQFAYIVSHDLRAPLVNLKGFAAELRSAMEVIGPVMNAALPHLDEKQRQDVTWAWEEDAPEALDFIDSSATRMDHFISALLKLSRLGRRDLHPEPVDMEAVVQATLQSLAHQIEERQGKVTVGPLPEVVADRTSMEQIMGNLLGNSVKYLDPDRPAELEITADRGLNETTFRVRDNGRGIAEDDMDKVFAPFRRIGRQDAPGEGMGLPYVQALVRRHGGRIWCESEPGVGTTFSFTIVAPPPPQHWGE